MTSCALPILAATVTRTTFEWGRIQTNTDWLLPIAVAVAVMLFVRMMYHADTRDLGAGLGWVLTGLRTAAMLVLLVLYLQPQWRTEQERRVNSRALLLVDTSLSMGLTDVAADGSTRTEHVLDVLNDSDLIDNLRKRHDLVVLRFSEELDRVVSLDKLDADGENRPEEASAETTVDWKEALAPSGAETRLGQALRRLIHDERSAPVAGIIVVTDGGQNSGVAPEAAVAAAREAKIPIFPVGVGSDQKPANVRLSDFIVPRPGVPRRSVRGDRLPSIATHGRANGHPTAVLQVGRTPCCRTG